MNVVQEERKKYHGIELCICLCVCCRGADGTIRYHTVPYDTVRSGYSSSRLFYDYDKDDVHNSQGDQQATTATYQIILAMIIME